MIESRTVDDIDAAIRREIMIESAEMIICSTNLMMFLPVPLRYPISPPRRMKAMLRRMKNTDNNCIFAPRNIKYILIIRYRAVLVNKKVKNYVF